MFNSTESYGIIYIKDLKNMVLFRRILGGSGGTCDVTKRYVDDGLNRKADKTSLASKQDKLTAGANITITDNVISASGGGGGGGTPSNMVTTDTAQNITGIKTFTNGIKIDGVTSIKGNTNITGITHARGNLLVDGTISISDKNIIGLATPTADNHAATKKYVDDGLALKQNKLTAGTNITIADNVISATGGSGSGDVTLDTAQTITGVKTFENGVKNNLIEVDGKSLIIKNSKTASSYLEVESVYSGSGYKNWFGMQFFRTTGASRSRLANLEIRQDDGLYIDSVNDLSFSANNIKFSNARLQGVRTPAADTDAATKKYADDGLNLKADKTELVNKQDKLTAGTNITIVGNTISASGSGGTGGGTLVGTYDVIWGVVGSVGYCGNLKNIFGDALWNEVIKFENRNKYYIKAIAIGRYSTISDKIIELKSYNVLNDDTTMYPTNRTYFNGGTSTPYNGVTGGRPTIYNAVLSANGDSNVKFTVYEGNGIENDFQIKKIELHKVV